MCYVCGATEKASEHAPATGLGKSGSPVELGLPLPPRHQAVGSSRGCPCAPRIPLRTPGDPGQQTQARSPQLCQLSADHPNATIRFCFNPTYGPASSAPRPAVFTTFYEGGGSEPLLNPNIGKGSDVTPAKAKAPVPAAYYLQRRALTTTARHTWQRLLHRRTLQHRHL